MDDDFDVAGVDDGGTRTGAVLRRTGTNEEYVVCADAGICDVFTDYGVVVSVWIFAGVFR